MEKNFRESAAEESKISHISVVQTDGREEEEGKAEEIFIEKLVVYPIKSCRGKCHVNVDGYPVRRGKTKREVIAR